MSPALMPQRMQPWVRAKVGALVWRPQDEALVPNELNEGVAVGTANGNSIERGSGSSGLGQQHEQGLLVLELECPRCALKVGVRANSWRREPGELLGAPKRLFCGVQHLVVRMQRSE